jgi:hypothetical protein
VQAVPVSPLGPDEFCGPTLPVSPL